jgi:hypothetical protein
MVSMFHGFEFSITNKMWFNLLRLRRLRSLKVQTSLCRKFHGRYFPKGCQILEFWSCSFVFGIEMLRNMFYDEICWTKILLVSEKGCPEKGFIELNWKRSQNFSRMKLLLFKISTRFFSSIFYLPHMEYEGSIDLVTRKMKKIYCWFLRFRTFYD